LLPLIAPGCSNGDPANRLPTFADDSARQVATWRLSQVSDGGLADIPNVSAAALNCTDTCEKAERRSARCPTRKLNPTTQPCDAGERVRHHAVRRLVDSRSLNVGLEMMAGKQGTSNRNGFIDKAYGVLVRDRVDYDERASADRSLVPVNCPPDSDARIVACRREPVAVR